MSATKFTRRQFLKVGGTATAAGFLAPLGRLADGMVAASEAKPPNILLIFSDQHQQRMTGCYGDKLVHTPNLDALAKQGALFNNMLSAQPVCTPARASLLTGTYGHTHDCVRNNKLLTTDIPTSGEIFKSAGYRCGYVGKWHVGNELVPQRGFEEFYRTMEDKYAAKQQRAEGMYSTYDRFLRAHGQAPSKEGPASYFTPMDACLMPEELCKPAYLAQEAEEFLKTADERPFFLTVSFVEPHPPYFSPFDDMYKKGEVPLPPNYDVDEIEKNGWSKRHEAFWRFYYEKGHNIKTSDPDDVLANEARYYGLINLLDKYVGKVLDSLERCGLADNTVVIYTSDHGDMMASHQMVDKGEMLTESYKIPLIIKDPRRRFAATRCETPVNLVDILPTTLDMAGLAIPDSVQGRSFLPVLQGDTSGFPDFGIVEWNGFLQGMHARDPRFEAVLNAHVRTVVTERWHLVLSPGDRTELYDMSSDPLERRNVFGRKENRAVVEELYAKLLDWQKQTSDPLDVPNPLETASA